MRDRRFTAYLHFRQVICLYSDFMGMDKCKAPQFAVPAEFVRGRSLFQFFHDLLLELLTSCRSLKAEPHLNAFMRSFFAVSYVLNTSQAVGMKHEDPNGESMSMFKNQFLVPVVTMPVILIKHRWRVFCARGHTEPVYGLNKHE